MTADPWIGSQIPPSLLGFLADWQPLLGGLAGGIFAISAALIVAYSERRREDRTAAALVFSRLDQLIVVADATEEAIIEHGRLFLECAREVGDLPSVKPSTAFGETIFRVGSVDEGVVAYLDATQRLLRMADAEFDRARALQQTDTEQVDQSLSTGLGCVLDAAEQARLATTGVALVMRPGIAAAFKRGIRRFRIRLGRLARGKWKRIYPSDVRPAAREGGPLKGRKTWKDRLQEELKIEDMDKWKLSTANENSGQNN